MKRCAVVIVVCVAVGMTLALSARACTTFCFDGPGGPVFGKNYDWDVEVGMLLVNKRGVSKIALTEDHPAEWTSRYGSVTFNQYGRELPSGGINERGLVVELMWLEGTRYPSLDDRPSLTALQWIQYQLDNSASVADVIASDAKIRITTDGTPLHFLVADRGGDCAAIEFIDGGLAAHTGVKMLLRVLTNSTYDASEEFAGRVAGAKEPPAGSGSLPRFARAAGMCARYDALQPAVDHAFSILADVAQGSFTKWSIVYDIGAMRVHLRTRSVRDERWLDVNTCDFDCASPVQTVDINAPYAADLAPHLVPYQRSANLALIVAAFAQTDFLRDTPRDELESLSRYPERTACGD